MCTDRLQASSLNYHHYHYYSRTILFTITQFAIHAIEVWFWVWFKGGFVYNALLWDKLWWLVSPVLQMQRFLTAVHLEDHTSVAFGDVGIFKDPTWLIMSHATESCCENAQHSWSRMFVRAWAQWLQTLCCVSLGTPCFVCFECRFKSCNSQGVTASAEEHAVPAGDDQRHPSRSTSIYLLSGTGLDGGCSLCHLFFLIVLVPHNINQSNPNIFVSLSLSQTWKKTQYHNCDHLIMSLLTLTLIIKWTHTHLCIKRCRPVCVHTASHNQDYSIISLKYLP